MKVKTNELIGPALDWAVAKCEGHSDSEIHWCRGGDFWMEDFSYGYSPSTDWAQGGPIIERERIWIKFPFGETGDVEAIHGFFGFPNIINAKGPTSLIAAMRCYVASKFGDEVDMPEELL